MKDAPPLKLQRNKISKAITSTITAEIKIHTHAGKNCFSFGSFICSDAFIFLNSSSVSFGMLCVSSITAVMVGEADSSARKRSKVCVLFCGYTCNPLANEVTTCGGSSFNIPVGISNRASSFLLIAFSGKVPVKA